MTALLSFRVGLVAPPLGGDVVSMSLSATRRLRLMLAANFFSSRPPQTVSGDPKRSASIILVVLFMGVGVVVQRLLDLSGQRLGLDDLSTRHRGSAR